MNYTASLSDFFKSPKWLPSLLLGGVCMLIPIVGPIALMGWHVTGFWGRKNPENFEHYPPFDFADFGKHLERGVWPFLVTLVLPLIIIPVSMVLMFIALPLPMLAARPDGQSHGDVLPLIVLGVMGLVFVFAFVGFMMVIRTLMLAACITQDFVPAFNLRRLKQFIALTWPEMLVSTLFTWIAAVGLMIAGMMVMCIGTYLTMSLVQFMTAHLDWQLYQLYLARGGEPIPVSAKLNDLPPPLLPPTA